MARRQSTKTTKKTQKNALVLFKANASANPQPAGRVQKPQKNIAKKMR